MRDWINTEDAVHTAEVYSEDGRAFCQRFYSTHHRGSPAKRNQAPSAVGSELQKLLDLLFMLRVDYPIRYGLYLTLTKSHQIHVGLAHSVKKTIRRLDAHGPVTTYLLDLEKVFFV
jgi:hypothetical protein